MLSEVKGYSWSTALQVRYPISTSKKIVYRIGAVNHRYPVHNYPVHIIGEQDQM